MGSWAQLPLLFAQTRPRGSSSQMSSAEIAVVVTISLVIGLAFYLFFSICCAKIFKKAGLPGWWGWVPYVNTWGLVKLTGREWWWFLLFFVPCVNYVALIVIYIDVAKSFGKEPIWAAGLIIVPFVFFPILAFGNDTYRGPAYPATGSGGYGSGGYGQGGYGQGGYGQGYPPPQPGPGQGYPPPQPGSGQQPPYPQQQPPYPQQPPHPQQPQQGYPPPQGPPSGGWPQG